jgi:hypothetical protein
MGYNAAVWLECRQFAVKFLEEAKKSIDRKTSPLFDRAIGHYQVVVEGLEKVSNVYPYKRKSELEAIPIDNQSQEVVRFLEEVLEQEKSGLVILGKLLEDLYIEI